MHYMYTVTGIIHMNNITCIIVMLTFFSHVYMLAFSGFLVQDILPPPNTMQHTHTHTNTHIVVNLIPTHYNDKALPYEDTEW